MHIAYTNNLYGRITAPSNITTFNSLQTGLPAIFNAALIAAVVIFIVLILVGGIQYLAAAGGEGTEKAKKFIQASVIGFILVMGTWATMFLIFEISGYAMK